MTKDRFTFVGKGGDENAETTQHRLAVVVVDDDTDDTTKRVNIVVHMR